MNDDLKDFYPTPKHLISKMLGGKLMRDYGKILEPSAGKGDICDYIKDIKGNSKIDAIEINPDMQHIIRGKGYNLIFDDFLSFNSLTKYDLIVANFPFSDGDKHLKKAIEILEQYGGDLICLVNAETIRNPYTNLRQAVADILKKHNAQITFIQDAFTEAERKTTVEVALIDVSIYRESFDSVIIDNLKKAQSVNEPQAQSEQLIEKDFVKALIARFNNEAKIGVNLIQEYHALEPHILNHFPKKGERDYSSPILTLTVNDGDRGDLVNGYLRALRKKYWSILIADSRFNSRYTSNIIEDLHGKLEDLGDYDFNFFNIEQLKEELNKSISVGIEDSIMKLFDEMSNKHSWYKECGNNVHYYNGWATNKAHKINKKVILPVNGFSSYSYGAPKIDNYYISRRLNDMVKVFNYFDNKVPDTYQLVDNSINQANGDANFKDMDFYYFSATFYKKGTCHIVFKDKELLDKFNIFGSRKKGWLPPSYGKKKYSEMNTQEKAVVAEFQGEREYEKVMSNPQRFILESNQLLLS